MADRARIALSPLAVAPLVGRDGEKATLRDTLAAALAGRGSLVLIGGEAGIGKTALAEWLLDEGRQQGALLLVGRCYDLSETPPYGPWMEALAGLVPTPEILPMLSGVASVASQATLFAQAREELAARAARQPSVLLLDDLHWADPASLDLLRAVARALAELPLLLLATYRADELTRRHPLYALLPLLVRESRATRLDLRRLGAGELRGLVSVRYGLAPGDEDRLVAYLVGRSEGNPFFAGELLRALEEGRALDLDGHAWALGDLDAARVPALLRQVLDARLDRLGEAARDLLAVAAVLGQEVPFDLWRAVAGADEVALLAAAEAAVAAHLLAEMPGGEGARFAHALVREALYEGLPGLRRRALHRRAAEALLAGPGPDPDALAYHLQRAGDGRAVEWLVKAGERAQAAFSWLVAAERFEAALALLERDETQASRRAQLHARLASLRRWADPRGGVAHLDEALRLVAGTGDEAALAHLTFTRGHLRGLAGDLRGGVAEMLAGAAALDALDPARRAALAATWHPGGIGYDPARGPAILAEWLAVAGRLAEARELGERFLAALTAAPIAPGGQDAALVDTYRSLGTTYFCLGQPERASDAFRRAREVAGTDYLRAAQAAGTEWLLGMSFHADRLAERRALSELHFANMARVGEVTDRPMREPLDGLLAESESRWDVARPLLLAWSRSDPAQLRALIVERLAPLLLARGEREEASVLLRAWLPGGPDTEPGATFIRNALALQRMAAAFALDEGDHARARAWLAAHDRWVEWSGMVVGRAEGQLGRAAYHRAAGDSGAARTHAEAALAHAAEPRQPLALLAAHRALGELDTDAARWADASAHLAAALALAEACAAPYERALTLLARAELDLARGDRDGAGAALAEARALLESLGARPALARADTLVAALARDATAAPTAAPTSAYPAGLSAREAEVLRLVAAGLTNAQAAERLYLSPRTVDQHLRSTYNKLGVSSRAAASRWAAEHGLTGEVP